MVFGGQTYSSLLVCSWSICINIVLTGFLFCILFIQDESCPAKSLLLELTQREGFSKPTYKTTDSGSNHMPTFFSTVEVDGVEFHGKASRSIKQAEHDAAKIAYIALKECKFIHLTLLSFIRITNKFGLYYYIDTTNN